MRTGGRAGFERKEEGLKAEGGRVQELWAGFRAVAQGSKLAHREILLGGSGEDLGGRCWQSQWVTWELSSHQFSPARTLIRLCLEATRKVALACAWCGHDLWATSTPLQTLTPTTWFCLCLMWLCEHPPSRDFRIPANPRKGDESAGNPQTQHLGRPQQVELEETSGRSNSRSFAYRCSFVLVQ